MLLYLVKSLANYKASAMSSEAAAMQASQLQRYEMQLGQALHLLEKDIYVRETRYLDESQTMGNVVHVSVDDIIFNTAGRR
jgi:hypothetical protein